MLPVGVVIPTRNCASLVPAHLAALREWIAEAEEVVVVDSESRDDTVRLIETGLDHPRLRVLQHPPGLYQSWNHGISQVNAPYVYLSTVGDPLDPGGLAHLVEVAERLDCDVVVSKPRFIDEADRPLPASRWPVDDIIETLGVQAPVAIEGLALFLLALVHCTEALLGSSASNLYRTRTLQAHPFPTGFGTVGDGAWGIENALRVRYGVTPQVLSSFRHHPKAYPASEYEVARLQEKLFHLARDTWTRDQARAAGWQQAAEEVGLEELFCLTETRLQAQRTLEATRRGRIPWILKPSAWRARLERRSAERAIRHRQRAALTRLGLSVPG